MKKFFVILGAPLAILTVIGMLSLLGLPMAATGFLHPDKEAAAEAKPEMPEYVDFRATPAGELMDSVFKELDKRGKASGTQVNAAGLPHPLACAKPVAPLSDSKAYNLKGDDVQVTISAYPAGLGGQVFDRLVNTVADCKPGNTAISTQQVDGLGVEANLLTATWAGNAIETTFFRRGDLIAFVATDQNKDSRVPAKLVDGLIADRMNEDLCVDQKAPARVQARNAFFAKDDFTGLRATVPLKAAKVPEPKLPVADRASGVVKVTKETKVDKVPEAKIPSDDFMYPLWPRLPKAVAYPKEPQAPLKQKLEDETWKRINDPVGPGCGWAFLTTVEPTFDADVVNTDNQARETAAQKALVADGPRWQKATVAYWNAYSKYVDSLDGYRDYKASVDSVAKAWEAIHADWRGYYSALAEWETYTANRQAFIARKDAAATAFRAQVARCEAIPDQISERRKTVIAARDAKKANDAAIVKLRDRIDALEVKDEASQDDGDPSTVEGPPLTSAETKELEDKQGELEDRGSKVAGLTKRVTDTENRLQATRDELATACPAVRPAILDEKAPPERDRPAEPADPRPASER